MLSNHVAAPSSSPAFSSPTVFRVRRKRTADPHGALVISLKRAKQMSAAAEALIEPIICQRATASDLQHGVSESLQINVIDVDPLRNNASTNEPQPMNVDGVEIGSDANIPGDDLLAVFRDASDETTSNIIVNEMSVKPSEITVNGMPLVLLSGGDNDSEFVFDYYWSSKAAGCKANEIRDIRLANADDLLLYDGEDTEGSVSDDESEDSNDENNWRNDYPDESEHTSGHGSDEDATSDVLDDYDDMERQLGGLYFYGDESSDDGDYDDDADV